MGIDRKEEKKTKQNHLNKSLMLLPSPPFFKFPKHWD